MFALLFIYYFFGQRWIQRHPPKRAWNVFTSSMRWYREDGASIFNSLIPQCQETKGAIMDDRILKRGFGDISPFSKRQREIDQTSQSRKGELGFPSSKERGDESKVFLRFFFPVSKRKSSSICTVCIDIALCATSHFFRTSLFFPRPEQSRFTEKPRSLTLFFSLGSG